MARLLGVVLPDDKRVEYTLTLVYGIGWDRSRKILKQFKIDTHKKTGELTEEELKKIIDYIEKSFKVEGHLREEVSGNIRRLRDIVSYRGMRHAKGLPTHGQRTRSNSRTKRGKRKTVGALRKEVWAKLEQNQTKSGAKK